MSTNTIPKPIAAILARESELQASVDRWSVESFRAERDRLETIVHSGAATDADIENHAKSIDGGELDLHFRGMQASSLAARDAFRRVSWPQFREFLKARLEARREREADIVEEVAKLREKFGITLDFSDPEASTTSQLAAICEREDVTFYAFKTAEEIF